jgi:hypothetical protein
MTDDASLRDDLAGFFAESAYRLNYRLQKNGIPLMVNRSRSKPVQLRDSWGILTEDVPVSILTVDGGQREGEIFRLAQDEIEKAEELGNRVAESASLTLPFWDAFTGRIDLLVPDAPAGGSSDMPDFSTDPGGWTTRCIILPALEDNLKRMPSLQRIDSASTESYANEVAQVAHDARWRYREIAFVSGVDFDSPTCQNFKEGHVVLRRISEEEQVQWLEDSGFRRSMGEIDPPLLALEVLATSPRGATDPKWPHSAAEIMAALELAGCRIGGQVATTYITPKWIAPVISPVKLTLPGSTGGRITKFSEGDFKATLNTMAALKKYSVEQPRSVTDLALHRFVSGCARPVPADAIIDFTIALESLLLPYDEATRHGDLGYRFRMHGAYYLSEEPEDRKKTFKELRRIYDMRSRLVHGSRYPPENEIIEICEIAYEVAQRGLKSAVLQGFPTADIFNSMILGVSLINDRGYLTVKSDRVGVR